jgi:hypothetical protein
MTYEYKIVVIDESGKYTKTREQSSLCFSKYSKCKQNEGYVYNLILGKILLLTKYNIDVEIEDFLNEDERNTELWVHEKEAYGERWNTY